MEINQNTKNIAKGIGLLAVILVLSYFHLFSKIGIWGIYAQILGYAFASGYLTSVLVCKILDRVSPWFKYWLQQKPMKYILITIFAFEFSMVFALGLDITFRTIVVWGFIPVYQTLSKLRRIPLGESMREKMVYLEGKI